MNSYRITSVTLTTYSGKKMDVKIKTGVFTQPLWKVKDTILDMFTKNSQSFDPFVKIDVRTKQLF